MKVSRIWLRDPATFRPYLSKPVTLRTHQVVYLPSGRKSRRDYWLCDIHPDNHELLTSLGIRTSKDFPCSQWRPPILGPEDLLRVCLWWEIEHTERIKDFCMKQ